MFQALKNLFSSAPKVRVPYAKGLPVTDENKFGEEAEEKQWIGVDLDGTLAMAEPWQGFEHIGKPVPNMVKRLNVWVGMGYTVKIVTARAADPEVAIPPIKAWLKKHGLPDLEVTNAKDLPDQEYFGPLLTLVRYQNLDQAIAMLMTPALVCRLAY